MSIQPPSKKVQALIIVIVALFLGYFLYSTNARGTIVSLLTKANSSGGLDVVNTPNTGGVNSFLKNFGTGSSTTLKGSSEDASDTSSTNITESLSKSLFANFMSLNSNNTLDSNSEQQLVTGLVSNIDTATPPPQYTLSDINVFPTNTSSLRTYGNQLAKTLSDFEDRMSSNPSNSVALASYQNMINNLKKIPVPSDLGLIHLQILNNFNVSYQSLSSIDNYQQDPAKALIAMKTLQTNNDDARALFKSIADEMQKNDIIFSTKESGYIWNDYQ